MLKVIKDWNVIMLTNRKQIFKVYVNSWINVSVCARSYFVRHMSYVCESENLTWWLWEGENEYSMQNVHHDDHKLTCHTDQLAQMLPGKNIHRLHQDIPLMPIILTLSCVIFILFIPLYLRSHRPTYWIFPSNRKK